MVQVYGNIWFCLIFVFCIYVGVAKSKNSDTSVSTMSQTVSDDPTDFKGIILFCCFDICNI